MENLGAHGQVLLCPLLISTQGLLVRVAYAPLLIPVGVGSQVCLVSGFLTTYQRARHITLFVASPQLSTSDSISFCCTPFLCRIGRRRVDLLEEFFFLLSALFHEDRPEIRKLRCVCGTEVGNAFCLQYWTSVISLMVCCHPTSRLPFEHS